MTDSEGEPLDTTVELAFAIYDDSISSESLWSETHTSVIITNGWNRGGGAGILIEALESIELTNTGSGGEAYVTIIGFKHIFR